MASMMTCMDIIQFVTHVIEHRAHFKSHSRHHAHTDPSAIHAFQTGWADAMVGLMIPLLISLADATKQNVGRALEGVRAWLQCIHSDHPRALKLRSKIFVTPQYHRLHHKHPPTKFRPHICRLGLDVRHREVYVADRQFFFHIKIETVVENF